MLFLQAIQWILDGSHWSQVNYQPGIAPLIGSHLLLSFFAVLFTVLIGLPIGLYIGHTGRGRVVAVAVAGYF